MARRSDRPEDAFPHPRQDIDYLAAGIELPRGVSRRSFENQVKLLQLRAQRAKLDQPARFDRDAWPVRNPTLAQAQVGDVLAGNLELRANCRCGHSAVVDPRVLAAKFDSRDSLRRIMDKVRCTQCRRYGAVALYYPNAPELNRR
jgi:hypothetical protein